MYQQQVQYLITLLVVVDSVIFIAGGYMAALLSWGPFQEDWGIGGHEFIGIILFLMFLGNFIMGRLGLYAASRSPSLAFTISRVCLSVFLLFAILGIGLVTLGLDTVPRRFILLDALLILALLILERVALDIFLDRRQTTSYNSRQILIVGSGERAQLMHQALKHQKSWGHNVIGFLRDFEGAPSVIDDLEDLGDITALKDTLVERHVDEVVFALSPECERGGLKEFILICEQVGVPYRIVPAMFDPSDSRTIRVESIQGVPTLTKDTVGVSPTGLLYKRLLDFSLGLVGTFIFIALYPPIALAIKLDSPGPVLYKQPRVGQHGRLFNILKFRTMVRDAEALKTRLMAENEMGGLMFKMREDPRVTRVGRFLRHTSLDEFPQFLNVVRGEMSIVGTRPPTVDEVKLYEMRHRRRISMKPGITGLWQVSGRNKINDFEEVVRLDLLYIDNWRFLNDLKIIWKTILVVLARKGAC